jgi:RNA polymerase sigma-70 factor (sigma-E family)
MVVDEPTERALPPYVPERPSATFEQLYIDAYGPMVRLAHLLTGSNRQAEELVQDAFVRVYGHWADVEHPRADLRQAVVNACRSQQRRHGRELRHGPGAAARAAASLDPEADLIRDALAVLSDRQRKAVVLRYYEDLPEAEIAAILGCRPGTVKSLLSRALAQLREVLPS